MRKLGFLLLLLAAPRMDMCADGVMQVSSTTPAVSTLDCSQHSTATITVQVWFTGIEAHTRPHATVRLSLYSTDPPGNTLAIQELDKRIELQKSPAIAKFEVTCGSGTRSGSVRVAAAIISRPQGVKIEDSPDAVATVNIRKQLKE
jgi:hypothetical protein